MKYFGAGLGEMHKELGTMIRKEDRLAVSYTHLTLPTNSLV